MLGVGGWLCLKLAFPDLALEGLGLVRVATPGVCIKDLRRMGGCKDISELERVMGALSGWMGRETRREARARSCSVSRSRSEVDVWLRGRGVGWSRTIFKMR